MLAAKLLASVVLSLVALALCVVVAVIGTAVAAPGLEHTWSLPVGCWASTSSRWGRA